LDVVQAFGPASGGGPEGPHYISQRALYVRPNVQFSS
jgi:hypothetical protein